MHSHVRTESSGRRSEPSLSAPLIRAILKLRLHLASWWCSSLTRRASYRVQVAAWKRGPRLVLQRSLGHAIHEVLSRPPCGSNHI